MILDERVHSHTLGGETGNHVGFGDDDLTIQDVVIGVVAPVNDKREIHHQTSSVALTVGAGIRLVGWHAVVGQELRFALSIDDDASAGAFHLRGDIKPATDEVQILILIRVWINRYLCRQYWTVGVFRVLCAPGKEG